MRKALDALVYLPVEDVSIQCASTATAKAGERACILKAAYTHVPKKCILFLAACMSHLEIVLTLYTYCHRPEIRHSICDG